ncbi:caspase family protein [Roseibium suaedae]|uniref:caspase family protein n=1 Tax=Roseibium suaedae TaxID=735517 RepID=UPI001587FBA8|nr:caspase family protein [Roseibium suaedae]
MTRFVVSHLSACSVFKRAGATAALCLIWLFSHLATSEAATWNTMPPTNPSSEGTRLALVIGNAAYGNVTPLANSVTDARSVANVTRDLGFTTTLVEDAGRFDMNQAIDRFLESITPDAEVMLYYAGHGVELQGANYLLPIDIPSLDYNDDRLLRSEAINLSDLILDIEGRSPRVTLAILDACRDNPFARNRTRSLGNTRGLARVDPPTGSFVIFSAGAGEAALDSLGPEDTNPNGLFTRNLLKLMQRDGVELRTMVRELRKEVQVAALQGTGLSQVPSYYDQLIGDFYFKPKSQTPANPASPKAPEPAAPPALVRNLCETMVDPDAPKSSIIFNDYNNIIAACEGLASEQPQNTQVASLLMTAREQQAYQRVVTSESTQFAEAYLRLFPDGRHRDEVQTHLASLTPADIQPQQAPAPAPTVTAQIDPEVLVRGLQSKLSEAGCYTGKIDGDWGRGSRTALAAYAKHSGRTLSDAEPSLALREELAAITGRVCPLECGAKYDEIGGKCVLKTCPSGQVLSSAGKCYVQKAKETPKRSTGGSRSGNCFMFNGQQFCD